MRFFIHACCSIWAWTCLVTLLLVLSQLTSSFALEDLFSSEYPAAADDDDSSSSLFLDDDDFGGGGGSGGLLYWTEPQPVFDLENDIFTSTLSSLDLLADASDDACIGFSPTPSSFKNTKARAPTSCNNPDINRVDAGAGAGAGTGRIESKKAITAEQIKRYWCTDFPNAAASAQEGGFGSIPVCYGPEDEGLSGSSEGGPILPENWRTGFGPPATDIFRTLYNCVLSELFPILVLSYPRGSSYIVTAYCVCSSRSFF